MKKARWARVLIVEDSPVVAKMLKDGISRDERLAVVGVAATARDAVETATALEPDILTLDLLLPDHNGLYVLRELLPKRFVPVVVVSALVGSEDSLPFQALGEGAVDLVAKPAAGKSMRAYFEDLNERLVVLAGRHGVAVHPGRRTPILPADAAMAQPTARAAQPTLIDCVVVGASTGGPAALAVLLRRLGAEFGAPIVIVQHIPAAFVEGLVRWLATETPVRVRLAHDGMRLAPGEAYVAPPDREITVALGGRLSVREPALPRRAGAPSADLLFESAGEVFGKRCAGVLLTGMGKDGAAGLLKLRQRGAKTFAQDESTSTVYGMPGAAAQLGAAEVFTDPATIGSELLRLAPSTESAP